MGGACMGAGAAGTPQWNPLPCSGESNPSLAATRPAGGRRCSRWGTAAIHSLPGGQAVTADGEGGRRRGGWRQVQEEEEEEAEAEAGGGAGSTAN